MMKSQIKIASRFCGPIDSANGGYTCGILSKDIEGTAEVTLRHPPPINQVMEIKQTEENYFVLYDQDRVIAEAKPAELELMPPQPPNIEVNERR